MAVYDDERQKTGISDDELRGLTGISKDEEGAMEREAYNGAADDIAPAKSLSSEELKESESSGATFGATDIDKSESAAASRDDTIGGGYKEDSKKPRLRLTRKQGIAGGITGLVVGGSFLGFTLMQPLQLLKLDFALGKHEKGQHLVAGSRIKRIFYRSAIQRDPDSRLRVGRTRLGAFSNRAFTGVLDRLEANQGVKFLGTEGGLTGTPRTLAINSLRGSPLAVVGNAEATRMNIAREFGVDPSRVTVTQNGSGGSVRLIGLSTKQLDGVVDGLAKNSGGGRFTERLNPRVTTSINKRLWRKTLNAPSLFHPLSRTSAKAGRSVDNFLLARRESKKADAERSRNSAKIEERESTARRIVKSKVGRGTLTVAGGAIALQGIMCTVKDLSGILPGVFYATVVMPAIIRTVQFQSLASQLRTGDDFNIDQMGYMIADLKDEQGGTVWQAKSLDSLANGGAGRGEDIDDGTKVAFTTKGSSIQGLYDLASDKNPDNEEESMVDSVAGWACSTPGRWLGLAGGIVLTGVSFVGCGATAGATCAGQAARVGSQAALGIAVFSVVSRMLGEFVADTASGKVADACGVETNPDQDNGGEGIDVVNAKAFGNCLAYASRMENNISGASRGSVPLSKNDEMAILREANEQELTAFKKKGLTERLFSTESEHSLAMRLIRESPDPGIGTGSFSHVASRFLNIPSGVVSGFSSVFSGSAQAQAMSYDWGFPAFGIPLNVLEDPKYADPVANADWIDEYRNGLSKGERDNYEEKIKKCFAVKLADGSEGLQTELLDDEINPLSDEYNDANCGDLSSESWTRTSLFVADDSIARSLDCFDAYGESCRELGFDNQQTQTTTQATGSDTAECVIGTPYLSDGRGATSENGIWLTGKDKDTPIRVCVVQGFPVNVRIENSVNEMLNAARASGVNLGLSSAFRTYEHQVQLRTRNCGSSNYAIYEMPASQCSPETAKPGTSNHEDGLAIDFATIRKCPSKVDGACADPSNRSWDWLSKNAINYGFSQYSREAWHWSLNAR